MTEQDFTRALRVGDYFNWTVGNEFKAGGEVTQIVRDKGQWLGLVIKVQYPFERKGELFSLSASEIFGKTNPAMIQRLM